MLNQSYQTCCTHFLLLYLSYGQAFRLLMIILYQASPLWFCFHLVNVLKLSRFWKLPAVMILTGAAALRINKQNYHAQRAGDDRPSLNTCCSSMTHQGV